MCGIAGLVLRDGQAVDEGLLRAMTDSLRHRGPDAGNVYVAGNVGLGHRRLSIIDTSSAANQPLFNEDGTVGVVFNGEIYNFQELTPELQARGHRFATRSDTEAIVHAWEEYGPACVERFRGMFSFALHDARQGVLFVARDRLGKKPLFYTASPGQFAFGSEIKALMHLPDFSKELDPAALGEYATYGNSLGERTVFRRVRKLPPAHHLLLNTRAANLEPVIRRYWEVRPNPDYKPTEQDWLDEMDRVLTESVRLRMISDVPLGAFLSGGIDSSVVVAYMAKLSPRVKTFTIGFHEQSHDESGHAAAVAQHLGTEHHVEYVTPNALEILPELVEGYDEPFADASALPTYYLSKLTRQHVTVALSGDGGDELFQGYPRYPIGYTLHLASTLATPPGRWLAKKVSRFLPYGTRPRGLLDMISRSGFDIYNNMMGHCDAFLSLLREDFRRQLPAATGEKMARDFHALRGLATRERYQYVDIHNYLPEDILVKVDRASMHYSLEVRCPILDHQFVELAARIPSKYQLTGFSGKKILKTLAYRHVPRAILDRPKMGFGVPLNRWFKGELAGTLQDMINDAGSPMWDYYDRPAASRRVHEHVHGNVDSNYAIWRLLFFYYWCDRHLRKAPQAAGSRVEAKV